MDDELSMLRQAWEEPAPPSQDAYSQARAALLSQATGATTTGAAIIGAGATGGAAMRGATIGAVGGAGPPAARRRHRLLPRLGIRIAAVGAFALAIVTGLTLVQSLGTGVDRQGRPTSGLPVVPAGPVANAQDALERAAVVAEARQFTPPRPDQWLYFAEQRPADQRRRAGPGGPLPVVDRWWTRVDGTRYASFVNGRLEILNTPGPPYGTVDSLPTDPEALLRWAYAKPETYREPAPYHAYSLFTHVLRENVLPPKLEAAIFRAMKKIPEVTLDRKAVDVLGRPTYALGMTSGGLHEDTLLDRKTYTYRGERSLAVTDFFDKPDPSCYKTPESCPAPDLIRKGTEFVFARITTAVVDRAGQIPTS